MGDDPTVITLGKSGAAVVLSLSLLAASATVVPAQAATTYKNCTAMHKKYQGGVARKGAHDKRASGHAKYKPHVSTALYNANKKSDRDKDGIACEQ